MISLRSIAGICLPALLPCLITPANADTYQFILRGKVTMRDGSPPPATAGIQRLCSDGQGSAPGPLTNKKGEYLWRMDVDNMLTRTCRLEATLAGYASSSIDISDLSAFISSAKELPPLILMKRGADPRTIDSNTSDVPSAARGPWKAAIKAVDTRQFTGSRGSAQTRRGRGAQIRARLALAGSRLRDAADARRREDRLHARD